MDALGNRGRSLSEYRHLHRIYYGSTSTYNWGNEIAFDSHQSMARPSREYSLLPRFSTSTAGNRQVWLSLTGILVSALLHMCEKVRGFQVSMSRTKISVSSCMAADSNKNVATSIPSRQGMYPQNSTAKLGCFPLRRLTAMSLHFSHCPKSPSQVSWSSSHTKEMQVGLGEMDLITLLNDLEH